jgi:tetratricopeptide (TPR) repeat protein
MRSLATLALLLLAAGAGLATDIAEPAKTAEKEFKAGWRQFLDPFSGGEGAGSLEARQEARLAAIPHFEAAVSAAPDNAAYRACLGYVCLSAGKYERAKTVIHEAIRLTPEDPLLHLLRAQAEAALAHMDPETTPEKVERAIAAFEKAARLDPDNSLAPIQAASVAFDAGRKDIALEMVQAALARRGMALYRLAIPGDLHADRATSLNLWQYAQMGQWMELLARAENVVRNILKLGAEKEKESEFESAREQFKQALAVAFQIGNARPNTFLTANSGLNALEDSYTSLARLAEATEDSELGRWQGETGVVYVGRTQLYAELQEYTERIQEEPPSSVDELMALQGRGVAFAMMGVGLSPTEKPEISLPSRPAQEAAGEEPG